MARIKSRGKKPRVKADRKDYGRCAPDKTQTSLYISKDLLEFARDEAAKAGKNLSAYFGQLLVDIQNKRKYLVTLRAKRAAAKALKSSAAAPASVPPPAP